MLDPSQLIENKTIVFWRGIRLRFKSVDTLSGIKFDFSVIPEDSPMLGSGLISLLEDEVRTCTLVEQGPVEIIDGRDQDERPSCRADLLMEALHIVTKDRNATHGEPEDSFSDIAGYWNAYLAQIGDRALLAHDIALMMDLFKTARTAGNPKHKDNWLDKAGYTACGYECATHPRSDIPVHGTVSAKSTSSCKPTNYAERTTLAERLDGMNKQIDALERGNRLLVDEISELRDAMLAGRA